MEGHVTCKDTASSSYLKRGRLRLGLTKSAYALIDGLDNSVLRFRLTTLLHMIDSLNFVA